MGQEPEAAKTDGPEPTATATETKVEKTEVKAEPQQFDADYVKQLRSEAAKYRTEAQEAKSKVQEFEDANASEVEKAQNKATKEAERASAAEAKLLRYEVANEKNVPAKLVPLLTASDRESLESQADLILENAKPETPDFNGGAREPAPEPKTPEEQHRDLILGALGRSTNT